MAVPTSNITLLSIQQEFGGAAANRRLKNYYGAAAGVPASGAIKFKDFAGKSADIVGSQLFTSSGTFTVPAGVTKVHVCCVGGGGRGSPVVDQPRSGGTGGACAYKNNIAVTPGQQITVVVTVDGDVNTTNGSYFKNTSTCNARTGIQCAANLGAANAGTAAFNGGAGGSGNSAIIMYKHNLSGGGGGAASMVANGPSGGNAPTGNTGSATLPGANGATASRAGGGGGSSGAYFFNPTPGNDNHNPDYLPNQQNGAWNWSSERGGGVGVVYGGPTGAAGQGSKVPGPQLNTVTAPTKGGKGSNGDYGAGGGAGTNTGTGTTNVYKGTNGAVRVKWGATNTYPWANEG